jgi:hypothetical protein
LQEIRQLQKAPADVASRRRERQQSPRKMLNSTHAERDRRASARGPRVFPFGTERRHRPAGTLLAMLEPDDPTVPLRGGGACAWPEAYRRVETNGLDPARMTAYGVEMAAEQAGTVRASAVAHTATTLALAVIVTGLPIVAHFSGQSIGIATCVVLGLLVANFATAIVSPVLIFSYLFQNLFVALASPHLADLNDFNAIRAYNFVLTASIWVVIAAHYWIWRHTFDRRFRILINVSFLALGLAAVYGAIGFSANPKGAAVYLRNIAIPFMLFQCFALVACRFRLTVHAAFVAMAWMLVAYGYCEALMHDRLFELTNGRTYLDLNNQMADPGAWVRELKEYGRVIRSNFDMLVVDFLNTPLLGDLNIKIHRLLGPNLHPISFAYAVAFFSLVMIAAGRSYYALIAAPLLLLVGSKGALVMVVVSVLGLVGSRFIRGRTFLWLFAAGLIAYAAAGIVIGLQATDWHVIGFIGGIKGFLHNPFGHGLGAGGNLRLDTTQIDWERSQRLGETDIGVESAVGVLLYQMGIAGIVILVAVAWIGWRVWCLYARSDDRLTGIVALGLFTIMVNGIFQEEALFAPLALGTMMALAGLLLGRDYRSRGCERAKRA